MYCIGGEIASAPEELDERGGHIFLIVRLGEEQAAADWPFGFKHRARRIDHRQVGMGFRRVRRSMSGRNIFTCGSTKVIGSTDISPIA
jgi:hypothetical protein